MTNGERPWASASRLIFCLSWTALEPSPPSGAHVTELGAARARERRGGAGDTGGKLSPPAARLLAAARERLGEAAVGAAGRRGRGRELDDAVPWALSLASQIAVGQ